MTERWSDEFDIKQPIYCAFCGQRLVQAGHMVSQFLLCPTHGEFTPGPTVMQQRDGSWRILWESEVARSDWNACQQLGGRE